MPGNVTMAALQHDVMTNTFEDILDINSQTEGAREREMYTSVLLVGWIWFVWILDVVLVKAQHE